MLADAAPATRGHIAVGLGLLFLILGVVGLFSNATLLAVIIVLMAPNVWTIAAAIALIGRAREIVSD